MKNTILAVLLFALLLVVSSASAEDIRVTCGPMTINVPSTNTKCYKVSENEILPEDADDNRIQAAQVASIALHIQDYTKRSALEPEVTLYKTDDLTRVHMRLFDAYLDMSDIINNLSGGYGDINNIGDTLPFLPLQAESRRVNALCKSLTFEGGSGVRFIAVFTDILNANASTSNVFYTFQGTSVDGNFYISAVFPLENMELDNINFAQIDWNSLDDGSFTPSLDELDNLITSIVLE